MIVAANWKMNPDLATASQLVSRYVAQDFGDDTAGGDSGGDAGVSRILFAPHPYLVPMGVRLKGSDVMLGGQDCHANLAGAHTGDVSAQMLVECGAGYVLLGHSERRSDHGESDALVNEKAQTAIATGLNVMICVGESDAQRMQGDAIDVVTRQLDGSVPTDLGAATLVIAYEPVWAIGTGKVASLDEIAEMHSAIRKWAEGRGLDGVAILYGGSVKPGNAADIFAIPDVSGALVGGASLDAEQFAAICLSASAAV